MMGIKRLMRNLTFAATLATVASVPAHAQTMWQNITLGMDEAQVLAAQPKATRNPAPSNLYDGSKCTVWIADYAVEFRHYNVCFYFRAGKLSQVTLGFNGTPSKSDYDDAIAMLTAKYGKPLSISEDSLGWNAAWLLDNGVNISVVFIGKKPLSPLININYQYRIKRASEGL